MTEWKQLSEGHDICPKCKLGILEYLTSTEEFIHTCDRCGATFKPKKELQPPITKGLNHGEPPREGKCKKCGTRGRLWDKLCKKCYPHPTSEIKVVNNEI